MSKNVSVQLGENATHLVPSNSSIFEDYRTLCGRVFAIDARLTVPGDESLMCQTCVRIENACACDDGPNTH